ncbi:MAG: hypothetical protein K2N01_06775, partial [Lachnospiraceae bacterium]|nr:hypothetical protein [Lachnospiraceae bacterium]
VNPIRDTAFAADPGLYYTVGNACTMAAGMLLPVSGSMTAAVNAGTSPVRAGLTELGMLGYSSVMAAESADIVTDITDSKLAGMFAGTIVAIGSYGGLKSLDQSVNISGLYPPKEVPNSYAELMPPEQAERYLRFLEKGSMEGLTDAEITAIRKVDEALALQKVDGQSVLELRRPVTTGESVSGTQTISNKFPNDNQAGWTFNFSVEAGKINIENGIQEVDFVIDMDGNLHIGRGHSYLANGNSVQAAGTMKVNSQGYIRLITNESGHYQPAVTQAMNYPDIFRSAGLNIDNAWIRISDFNTSMSNYVINADIFYNGPIQYMPK